VVKQRAAVAKAPSQLAALEAELGWLSKKATLLAKIAAAATQALEEQQPLEDSGGEGAVGDEGLPRSAARMKEGGENSATPVAEQSTPGQPGVDAEGCCDEELEVPIPAREDMAALPPSWADLTEEMADAVEMGRPAPSQGPPADDLLWPMWGREVWRETVVLGDEFLVELTPGGGGTARPPGRKARQRAAKAARARMLAAPCLVAGALPPERRAEVEELRAFLASLPGNDLLDFEEYQGGLAALLPAGAAAVPGDTSRGHGARRKGSRRW